MEEDLNNVWADFTSVMAERGARLSVALMFYRSAEKVLNVVFKVARLTSRVELNASVSQIVFQTEP